jgi:hypothetical protein
VRGGPPVRGAVAPRGDTVLPAGAPALGAVGRAPVGAPGRRETPGGGGIGLPDALSGRPGGGGMGRPEELSGGRGGRVAPGPGPTGGPVLGAVRGAAGALAAAAWAAASRSIEGVAGRGVGAGGAGSTGAVLVEAAAVRWDDTTRAAEGGRGGGGAGVVSRGAGSDAGCEARAGSAGSAGDTERRRPSASARRRTRSAWASSIDDEWLFTPMPREIERSSASLFVRPSSLASS